MRTRTWLIPSSIFLILACGSENFSGTTDTDAGPGGGDAALDADAGNTGVCAVDCQGGACVSGACQPVVLASGLNGPYGVTLHGTSMYVTEFVAHGRVVRFDRTTPDQTPQVVADESVLKTVVNYPPYVSQPFSIAVSATGIYWTDLGGVASGFTKLFRLSLGANTNVDGGAIDRFYELCAQGEVAVDDLKVFWANQGSQCAQPGQNGLFRADPASGHDGSIYYSDGTDAGAVVTPLAVAVDATHTFVGAGNQLLVYDSAGVNDPSGVTDSAALLGGSGPLPAPPYAIASDFANVVWTDYAPSGKVYSLAKNAALGTAPALLTQAQNGPLGIVIDDPGNYVYFTTYGDGQLMRIGKDGSNLQVVLSGLDHPAFLASDANTLYFTNFGTGHGDGTVMRVAKPAP